MSDTPRTDRAFVSSNSPMVTMVDFVVNAAFARTLERELAEEKARHAWQPIATAPKDATRVILWDGYIRLAAWRTTTNSGDRTAPCWVETDCEDSFYNEYVEVPTHWMPLPPRPLS